MKEPDPEYRNLPKIEPRSMFERVKISPPFNVYFSDDWDGAETGFWTGLNRIGTHLVWANWCGNFNWITVLSFGPFNAIKK